MLNALIFADFAGFSSKSVKICLRQIWHILLSAKMNNINKSKDKSKQNCCQSYLLE